MTDTLPNCPFCAAPLKKYYDPDELRPYDCGTIPGWDTAERSRTHACYQNEINALKTGGETDYARGYQDGIDRAFDAMAEARSSWKVNHAPARLPHGRDE